MMKNEKASLSIKRIAGIAILLIFLCGVGVMATNIKVNNVKIVLSNHYEMNVLTTKTNINDILEENHILLLEDEKVTPSKEENISKERIEQEENKEKKVRKRIKEEKIEQEKSVNDEKPTKGKGKHF